MAEISLPGAENQGGKIRAKKHSTTIDMTPMVDLAFLLLTFFILTTTMLRTTIITLTMPEPVKDQSKLPMLNEKNAFSIVLAKNNKIYWWIGLEQPASPTNYSKEGIRKILLKQHAANPDLMILIKPMRNSRYENIVDILDEVEIANIKRYGIVEVSQEDQARISARD